MPAGPPTTTTRGDVLILCTAASFRTCMVGVVTEDGQQDFHGQDGLSWARTPGEAIEIARGLASPESRIYLTNLDTGQWRLVPS